MVSSFLILQTTKHLHTTNRTNRPSDRCPSLESWRVMIDPANTRSLRASASSAIIICQKEVHIIAQFLGASIVLVSS